MSDTAVFEVALAAARARVASRPLRQDIPREIPSDWRGWLSTIFPGYIREPFADYHAEYWRWIWSIRDLEAARPFVAVWPRGFGKSTSVEVGCAVVAARSSRRYALYVCATQDQADKHVSNVAGLLESPAFAQHYAAAGRRRLGKYGSSAGWRRNRLRTESGFTLDAIGLDTAARGAKVDEDRPDLIIFDDIDEILDSPATVTKKETIITKSLLPARASHAAVLVAQNLVHESGVVARLVSGAAGYLSERIVSGPHPAIEGLTTATVNGKTTITGGVSTWAARSLEDLQRELDDIGISAFLTEKQHEIQLFEGGIFEGVTFLRCEPSEVPPLRDVQVWVDPAVTDTDKSDAHGVQADGVDDNGRLYRLFSWEQRASPERSLAVAILKARELGASCVGVETNQGGDTWFTVYESTWNKLVRDGSIPADEAMIDFREEKAGGDQPKAHRATQMLAAYERGDIVHVSNGTVDTLERALRRYLLRKPYDLVDAAYWGWYGLATAGEVLIG